MPQQSVKVKIYGNDYSLRGDTAERTQRAADVVDSQMTLFHAKAPDQSTNTIAVLTALNIAEQHIAQDDEMRDLAIRMGQLAQELESRIAGK